MKSATSKLKIGLVQMCTGRTVEKNLVEASRLIREAVSGGAVYVQTPEVTTLMEMDRAKLFVSTAPEDGNAALAHFRALARELKIWLHIGSMGILVKPDKIANRAFLISPEGAIVARYDKIHMFDVNVSETEQYRESAGYRPGQQAVLAAMPFAKIGMTVCYDLRFPQLYRRLAKAGAQILTVPSAFNRTTGAAHWESLLRARAIENGAFVLAPAQCGTHAAHANSAGRPRRTHGHSLAVAPWGEVLADAGTDIGVTLVDLDLTAVAQARTRIPSLDHDRDFRGPL